MKSNFFDLFCKIKFSNKRYENALLKEFPSFNIFLYAVKELSISFSFSSSRTFLKLSSGEYKLK